MTCGKELLVQAYFDGEIEAARVFEIEGHLSSCTDCQERMEADRQLRFGLRKALSYHRAPERLLAKITPRSNPQASLTLLERIYKWTRALRGPAMGAFCSAALILAVVLSGFTPFSPSGTDFVVEDVTTAHMRSLLAGHLIDVVSTDQHTVKPWFNGRVDVSPPVANFAAQGFRLAGGRLDYVGQRIVAVTVYRRGNHVINLFSWPDKGGTLPTSVTRGGYNLLLWRQDNLVFCAISDLSADDLGRFASLVKGEIRSQHRE